MKLAAISSLLAVMCLTSCKPTDDSAAVKFTITDMHAYPYYADTGELRKDVDLFSEHFMLVHSVVQTGEFEIPTPTTTTVVQVAVSAEKGASFLSPPTLELRAIADKSGRKVKLERLNLGLTLSGEGSRWMVPFMLYGTGCDELEVSAQIIAGRRRIGAPQKRKIRAACFE